MLKTNFTPFTPEWYIRRRYTKWILGDIKLTDMQIEKINSFFLKIVAPELNNLQLIEYIFKHSIEKLKAKREENIQRRNPCSDLAVAAK